MNGDKNIKTELINLWNIAKTLRASLNECQLSINSETARIQSECLKQIANLETSHFDMNAKLTQAHQDVKNLNEEKKNINEAKKVLKENNCLLEEQVINLEMTVVELTAQLHAETKSCKQMEDKVGKLTICKLNMGRRATELECELNERAKQVDQLCNEKQILKEGKCDLEIVVAENDVYATALQEHMDELEGICATLREQRDEQNGYFLQRELSVKNEFNQQLDKIKKEKSILRKDLTILKSKHTIVKDELSHLQTMQKTWINEKDKLNRKIEDLTVSIKSIENDLNIEKETVDMLSAKNDELATSMLLCKSEFLKTNSQSHSCVSNESANQIEDMVKKFYVNKMKTTDQFNEERIEDLLKQLAECDDKLRDEKQARRDAEVRSEVLSKELEKTKRNADALMELNVTRCQNSLNRSAKSAARRTLILSEIGNLSESLDFAASLTESNSFKDHEDSDINALLPKTNDCYTFPAMHSLSNSGIYDAAAFNKFNKSAEKIKKANEKAIEKLKQMSLM